MHHHSWYVRFTRKDLDALEQAIEAWNDVNKVTLHESGSKRRTKYALSFLLGKATPDYLDQA